MTNVSLVVLLLAPVLGQMGDEFYQDFCRGPIHPALGQFGPDAARVIQPAPDGLRIVLLAKRPEPGGVGVTPQFRISANTHDVPAAVSISLTDLRIRADRLP